VEPERQLGAAEVVVDRLRHPDDRHALLGQARRDAERVITADGDQRIDALGGEHAADLFGAVDAVGERVGPRGAEDRAAASEDSHRAGTGQLERVALEHAGPAMAEADAGVVRIVECSTHDRADHRVEPGAVSPTGQDADACHVAAAYETRRCGLFGARPTGHRHRLAARSRLPSWREHRGVRSPTARPARVRGDDRARL
jgi:hypothetical protein